MKEQMFSKKILEEYDVLKLAVPHYDDLERAIQKPIADYIKGNTKQKQFNILESGYGTMITTDFILETDPKIHVDGYDDSIEMFNNSVNKLMERAKQNGDKVVIKKDHAIYYTKDGFKRLTLHNKGIEHALKNTKANYYDGFASGYMIHNLSEQQRAEFFKKLSRIIKVGGFFVNADKYAQDNINEHNAAMNKQLELFDLFVEHGYPEMKTEWVEHTAKDDKIRFTEGEQQKLLKQNGFSSGKIIFREMMEATMVSHKLKHLDNSKLLKTKSAVNKQN